MPTDSPSALAPPRGPTPRPVAAWLIFCAGCNVAGWLLSAIGQLNAAGYCLLGITGLAAAAGFGRHLRPPLSLNWCAARRRFAKPFPAAFLLLAFLAILGGFLYLPTNYDALAYRTPRVLNWLAEQRWHWIDTQFNRLNTRAMGFEWLAAPIFSLTGSDRLLFLVNAASFLLLPGLVFSAFTRLGVAPRTAWHWMWIFPTGYCFLLQAGSIANDLFGAVFALAALDFALRARTSRNVAHVWFSLLAAALLTGAKASNLPLLLPWLVAIFPSLPLLRQRLATGALVLVAAALSSLLPLTLINLKHSGDWTGLAAEKVDKLEKVSALNFANNTVLLSIQNLAPPVFPLAGRWNEAVPRHMPPGLRARLVEAFEPGGARWLLGELQVEESAGIGFGVSALALVTFGVALRRRGLPALSWPPSHRNLILACALAALAAFMLRSGLTTAARLITPYYAFLLPALLLASDPARLWRERWWRAAATGIFALAALVLVLSPARPMWPAQSILHGIPSANPLLIRARSVYDVFSQRADAFAQVRAVLPPDARVVGLVAFDDPETSLWRPFGSRRVVQVTRHDTAADLRRKQMRYIVVNPSKLEFYFQCAFADWLRAMDAEVTHELTLPLRVTLGSSQWRVVRLRNPGE